MPAGNKHPSVFGIYFEPWYADVFDFLAESQAAVELPLLQLLADKLLEADETGSYTAWELPTAG